jgi:uncharacterized membrane protein YphA (DoxX/SURF4 family)
MNVVIWIVQILLALLFAAAGIVKLTQPREKLRAQMGWVDDYSDNGVKGVGAVELLGAIGLILPAWTGILPILTPLAAVGFMIVMVLAAATHLRRNEGKSVPVNVVLFLLALFVAIMRFGPYHY